MRMTPQEFKRLLKGKDNKYNAKKSYCSNGHLHDSLKEAKRCDELHLLLMTGAIADLELQKPYLIIPALYETIECNEVYKVGKLKGQKKTKRRCVEQSAYYKADFVYLDTQTGKTVIEDSKGKRTKDYILKRKLMKHQYCSDGKTVFIET